MALGCFFIKEDLDATQEWPKGERQRAPHNRKVEQG